MKAITWIVIAVCSVAFVVYSIESAQAMSCLKDPVECLNLGDVGKIAKQTTDAADVSESVNYVFKYVGGRMRKYNISASKPTPQTKVGLYVYVLPQREVGQETLAEIEKFHFCLPEKARSDKPTTVALLILPTRATGDNPPVTDLDLAEQLMQTAKSQDKIDKKEVYLIVTDVPVDPSKPSPAIFEIRLGRIAPPLIGNWLSEMKELVEAGDIKEPQSFVAKARTVAIIVGSVAGEIFGAEPAEAKEVVCH